MDSVWLNKSDDICSDQDYQQPEEYKFLGMKLNPSIVPKNLISIAVLAFIEQVIIGSQILCIFVLMDPDYYNLDDDTLSQQYATLSAYSTAITLSLSFLIGAYMDQSGRFFPLITGLLLQGISTLIIPFPKTIYPYFFLSNIMFSIGSVPLMNTPLIPDYIDKFSIGKGIAFEKCFELIGSLVGNQFLTYLSTLYSYYTIFIGVSILTGIFKMMFVNIFYFQFESKILNKQFQILLEKSYLKYRIIMYVNHYIVKKNENFKFKKLVQNIILKQIQNILQLIHINSNFNQKIQNLFQKYYYQIYLKYSLTNFSLLGISTIIMFFTLKDVTQDMKKRPTFTQVLFDFYKQIINDYGLLLSVLAFMVALVGSNTSEYVTLALSHAVEIKNKGNKQEALKEAKLIRIWLQSITSVLTIPVSFLIGYLSDRYQIWKIQTIVLLLIIASTYAFTIYIDELSFQFYLYSELNGFFILSLSQMSFTYVNKTATKSTRTITLSFVTFFMNVSMLFIDPVMGNLYAQKGREWPFYLALLTYIIMAIATLFGGINNIYKLQQKL